MQPAVFKVFNSKVTAVTQVFCEQPEGDHLQHNQRRAFQTFPNANMSYLPEL